MSALGVSVVSALTAGDHGFGAVDLGAGDVGAVVVGAIGV